MRGFMAACDCLLFLTDPRLGEGFGLAALEAMAAGLPVVATRVASLPEIVGPDAGVLVPPGSAEAVAAALRQLASDTEMRGAMGRLATARATECFDLASMVERTANVYREVLA
jgi:glycosyltransferase involved in cell wall biosynthesis